MTGIMRILLLAAILTGTQACPMPCECMSNDSDIKCSLNKTTVELTQPSRDSPYINLLFKCEDSNIACSDLPQLNITSVSPVSLKVVACSPSVLRCLSHVMHEPMLTDITLNTTSEPLTNEDLENLDNVTSLNLILADADTFTVSNMTAISSLRNLIDFTIHKGTLQLSSHMFSRVPGLEMLRFFENNITSLPVDVFKGLANLIILVIHRSNIENISAGAFRGLDSVEQIHLHDAKLNIIEAGAFPVTSKLNYVGIEHNQLALFPNGVLQGMEGLGEVLISDNQVELTLGSSAFANLPAFTKIQLFNSKIRSLPENLFKGCVNLKEIYITVNDIKKLPSRLFMGLSSLMRLDLSGNGIQELPIGIFKNLHNLEELDLTSNNLKELSIFPFDDLVNLKELRLNNNNINHLGVRWSMVIKKPHKLDRSYIVSKRLDHKALHGLTAGFWEEQTSSSFNALKHLTALDLSGNEITEFYKGWEFEMPNIEVMDLSWNQITDIQHFDTDFSKLKVIIDLQYNNISNVLLDPRISTTKDEEPVNSYLILDNNPISCDCHSYGLYRRLNGARASKEPIYVLSNSSCMAPSELEGKSLKDVLPDELVCSSHIQCPSNCSSCIFKAATNEVIFKCPEMPPSLPDQESINLQYSDFEEPTLTLNLDYQPKSITGLHINTLNLSNTGINEIAFRPAKSLKILDVSHNNLKIIPDEFFKANITLYLSDNPLECDCSFTRALHEYDLVADFKQSTCANGDKIAQISVARLCNREHTLVAYIGTCIVCSFFLIMVAVTIYRKHSRRICITISRTLGRRLSDASVTLEGRLFAVKDFDLFISFAHEDEEFVREKLLPKLEKDFKQKVCVHYRDWTVGDLIPDQIIKSVESSRRTIIILTENFLSSEWSYLEFRTAHNLSIQEGRPRVIVILLNEETTKDERLGNDLKSYISLNTYLLWGDPNFWDKLKKILPKQGWK